MLRMQAYALFTFEGCVLVISAFCVDMHAMHAYMRLFGILGLAIINDSGEHSVLSSYFWLKNKNIVQFACNCTHFTKIR